MRKLYVKKLGSIALMSLVFFGIYFLATFLLQTFVNFIESNLIKALIFLAIPAIFVVIRIYRRRLENAELRRAYLNQIADQEITWKQQLKYVLKSADFRAIAIFGDCPPGAGGV